MRALVYAAVLVIAGAPAAPTAAAQFPPDTLTNLKVFPQDITPRQLIDVMRTFSFGLGVRCQFCHVGEEGQPLSTFDFASDEKVTKRKARDMIEMVRAINERHLSGLEERTDPAIEVGCETCHHGVAKPQRIQDVLAAEYPAGGADAVAAKYRALRAEYYGTAAYDFGEGTLPDLAGTLVGRPDVPAAIAVLQLNLEYFPASSLTHFVLGEAHRAAGDTTAAVQSYEKALELDADNRGARMRLQQLGRE